LWAAVWFAIFFLNFLIEEYDLTIKILIIGVVGIGFVLLWAAPARLGRRLPGPLQQSRLLHQRHRLPHGGDNRPADHPDFLAQRAVPLCGLHAELPQSQGRPTEAGEQLGREDYNTRIDTGDFLERLLGFGRIVITFKDNRRPPLTMLVWRVDRKAEMLERVRAKFAIDHPQHEPLTPPTNVPGLTPLPPEPTPPASN